MTVTKNYYTSSNYETIKPIPSREEFHKFASNLLADGDFCTEYASGYQINRVAQAIDWTIKKTKPKTKADKRIKNNVF